MKIPARVGTVFLGLVLATTGIATFAPPAAASGGTAAVNGDTITFTGTAEADEIYSGLNVDSVCEGAPNCVHFFALDGVLTAGAGCDSIRATVITCATPNSPIVTVSLDAGDDFYSADLDQAPIRQATVDGGEGNDTLNGGGAPETLIGGNGNDIIYPDQGPNALYVGPDTLIGGAGSDALYYTKSAGGASGVRMSANGVADDGTTLPRDIDNIGGDFEAFVGTNGDDVLVGDGRPSSFYGLNGNDSIDGGGGNDILIGHTGDDHLTGGPGVDTIWGDSNTDPSLSGNDTIVSTDGESDQVTCGPGTDAVTADSLDKILDTCESVTVGSGTLLSAEVQVTKPRLNANKRRKKATLALQCTGGLVCAGTVVVRTTKGKSRRIAGNKKLALGTFTLAANSKKTVKLKLRKPARKILKQTRRAGVRARLTLTNERVTTFTNIKLTR